MSSGSRQGLVQRPTDFRCRPECGPEGKPDPGRGGCRIYQAEGGEAEGREPATYCRRCRRSFFPQTRSPGIDRTEWRPTLRRQLGRAGTASASCVRGSADRLDYLDLKAAPEQVERLAERIGRERRAQRDAAV